MLQRELKNLVNVYVRDLLFESYGEHPVTADVGGIGLEDETPRPAKSLDYIFFMQQNENLDDDVSTFPTESCKVEPFLVNRSKTYPGTRLSDHYGVDCYFRWL